MDLSGQTVFALNKPLVALLGRDVMTSMVLIYNGPAGMFSLSF